MTEEGRRWTGLVAPLTRLFGFTDAKTMLAEGVGAVFKGLPRPS